MLLCHKCIVIIARRMKIDLERLTSYHLYTKKLFFVKPLTVQKMSQCCKEDKITVL